LVTDAQGNVTDTRADLAFGDGAHNLTGSRDGSFDGYAGYWDGVTAATNHAQFREYSNLAGRWMSPDPYDGSYRAGNPQSFNRYTYVLNNPLSKVDPLGLDETETCSDNDTPCFVDPGGDGGGGGGGGGGCPVDACVTAPPNPPVDPNDPFQCYACFLGSIPQPGQYVPPAQNAGAPNSGPPLPCQVQTQTALNNNLNTSAIYQAPTFQLQGQAPGFRGGNYNYNYFLPGVTQAQILQATGGSGRFSGGLHIPQPGGPDPITAIYGGGVFDGQNGSFVTAHLDSANPLDDLVSLIEHFINDVVLQRGRGGCK
jgi:RHS repeat-associated protein